MIPGEIHSLLQPRHCLWGGSYLQPLSPLPRIYFCPLVSGFHSDVRSLPTLPWLALHSGLSSRTLGLDGALFFHIHTCTFPAVTRQRILWQRISVVFPQTKINSTNTCFNESTYSYWPPTVNHSKYGFIVFIWGTKQNK